MSSNPSSSRIEIIDALRGFALLGILLIHGVEQFNLFYKLDHHFLFSKATNEIVTKTIFFLISQKAYSIFALLFGFSFFIQMRNQELKGVDFRFRFVWRLLILAFFGAVHGIIYNGDILFVYAVMGLPLVLIYRVKNNVLWVIAILFALQTPLIIQLLISFNNESFEMIQWKPDASWREFAEVMANGNLREVMIYNNWEGRLLSYSWVYNTGRANQLVALFIVGFLLGKKEFFNQVIQNTKTILRILGICVVLCIACYYLSNNIGGSDFTKPQIRTLKLILNSYYNLSYTAGLIALFILLYQFIKNRFMFEILAVYGRMSLTNYVSQTLVGTIVFYGFGFGMYRYMGNTWGLIYAIFFFMIQVSISMWWSKQFYYGPLEWLWRAITYFNFKIKFRKGNLNG